MRIIGFGFSLATSIQPNATYIVLIYDEMELGSVTFSPMRKRSLQALNPTHKYQCGCVFGDRESSPPQSEAKTESCTSTHAQGLGIFLFLSQSKRKKKEKNAPRVNEPLVIDEPVGWTWRK